MATRKNAGGKTAAAKTKTTAAKPAARTSSKAATSKPATKTGGAATAKSKANTEAVVAQQREVQRRVDALPKQSGGDDKKKPAVQAGKRKQPTTMPAQHIAKPGNEHELELRPRFEAPDYVGSGKLDGMKAIVTGADSGIGRAVAVLFAREGADVAVLYLDEHDDAQETARHVEKEGRQCLLIPGDVRSVEFCEQAVAQVVEAFGKLDVLVNNAAFQLHSNRLEDLDEEHLQQTLQTNVGGYFHMARAVLPHMGEGASIINTGSETGLKGSKNLLDYSATKGAIHAFTLALASNLLPRGIRVNAVAPGPVWTPLNPADKSADDVAEFGQQSDMGRAAQPEEVSPAYVFLASPVTASYISGIILPVMGGPGG